MLYCLDSFMKMYVSKPFRVFKYVFTQNTYGYVLAYMKT